MLLLIVGKLELRLQLAKRKKLFIGEWNLLLQLLMKADVSECRLINVKARLKEALEPFGISEMLLVLYSHSLLQSNHG
jgi:hypothetical protein